MRRAPFTRFSVVGRRSRTVEEAGPYKPSPAGDCCRFATTLSLLRKHHRGPLAVDEESRFVRNSFRWSRIAGCRGRLSCCGARKNLRACAFLDFFDRCHSLALPFSATGSGRARPLRVCAQFHCWSRIADRRGRRSLQFLLVHPNIYLSFRSVSHLFKKLLTNQLFCDIIHSLTCQHSAVSKKLARFLRRLSPFSLTLSPLRVTINKAHAATAWRHAVRNEVRL